MMIVKRVLAFLLLGLFLVGCSSKEIVTQVEIRYVTIPKPYFKLKQIDTNRSIITDVDVSEFMLELYRGYNECR
ncbi:hypothetical protein CVIC9261_06125 [Campylobacter vicugnae]|uniref:Lipoprotein n=1 Tax=Campylobacter vicugnae TaxID=1660076 RepID=A0ABZ2E6F9_9BACT